jgi:hypothetical protein
MRIHVTTSVAALLLAGCQGGGSGADGVCPVLPAARAVASFEHRGHASEAGSAGSLPRTWPEYVLRADSGYAMPRAGLAQLCGVHLVVRDSLGRTVAEVIAATGELDRGSELVVVRGDVIVDLLLQGRRIETEELHFAPRDNRVWSTTTTTFREGDAVLTGSSFTADRYFETIRLEQARGGVRSIIPYFRKRAAARSRSWSCGCSAVQSPRSKKINKQRITFVARSAVMHTPGGLSFARTRSWTVKSRHTRCMRPS